jgi:hypothetical protein
VQTFYQPLLSNPTLAISLQQFFSLPKASHTESKKPVSSISESFIISDKQGEAGVLREGCDILTGETCVPASLNVNNLGEAAVLHFPLP